MGQENSGKEGKVGKEGTGRSRKRKGQEGEERSRKRQKGEEKSRKKREWEGRGRHGKEKAGKGGKEQEGEGRIGKDQEVLLPAQVPAAEAELPQLPFLLERGTAGGGDDAPEGGNGKGSKRECGIQACPGMGLQGWEHPSNVGGLGMGAGSGGCWDPVQGFGVGI